MRKADCNSSESRMASLQRSLGTLPGRFFRFFVETDPSAGHDRRTHITFLCIMITCTTLPFFLRLPSSPGSAKLSFFGLELPSACPTYSFFGFECPGCGLTRSFVSLAHGRFQESIGYHRLGLLLYVFCLSQVGFRTYALRRLRQPLPERLLAVQTWIAWALIALLIVNWMAGFFLGANGSQLVL